MLEKHSLNMSLEFLSALWSYVTVCFVLVLQPTIYDLVNLKLQQAAKHKPAENDLLSTKQQRDKVGA